MQRVLMASPFNKDDTSRSMRCTYCDIQKGQGYTSMRKSFTYAVPVFTLAIITNQMEESNTLHDRIRSQIQQRHLRFSLSSAS